MLSASDKFVGANCSRARVAKPTGMHKTMRRSSQNQPLRRAPNSIPLVSLARAPNRLWHSTSIKDLSTRPHEHEHWRRRWRWRAGNPPWTWQVTFSCSSPVHCRSCCFSVRSCLSPSSLHTTGSLLCEICPDLWSSLLCRRLRIGYSQIGLSSPRWRPEDRTGAENCESISGQVLFCPTSLFDASLTHDNGYVGKAHV